MESVEGLPYLATPYLQNNVVDIVRNQAMGITGQMKLANLAEMFGKNTHGGHAQVLAAIRNDDWYEHHAREAFQRGDNMPRRPLSLAASELIKETSEVRDGYMYVPQTPGLGREIDWEQIEARTIMEI